jgi:hypothetical protein
MKEARCTFRALVLVAPFFMMADAFPEKTHATAPRRDWRSFRTALGHATLGEVLRALALPREKWDAASSTDLGVALYVLEQEGATKSGAAVPFLEYLNSRSVTRRLRGGRERRRDGSQVLRHAAFLSAHFSVPCAAKRVRVGGEKWPPRYECEGGKKPAPLPSGPEMIVALRALPAVQERPPGEGTGQGSQAPAPDPEAFRKRIDWIRSTARKLIHWKDGSSENLPHKPTRFCAGDRCFGSYREVAAAIYGDHAVGESKHSRRFAKWVRGRGIEVAAMVGLSDSADEPPVFCAPAREGADPKEPRWSTTTVQCSSDWRATVGKGEADSPDWACLGSPAFFRTMVLPEGGEAGGFRCRRRIFRIVRPPKAELSEAADEAMRGEQCNEMRFQTWGEEIAKDVAADRAKKEGKAPAPFRRPRRWPLTREELLFFYGHTSTYCRADRQGLVHRTKNKEWAQSFTCNVSRGILEAGPFEEGVQVCATTPYTDKSYGGVRAELKLGSLNRGRLHCWKFARPMCNELSQPGWLEKRIWAGDVFDDYDTLRELRRTRDASILSLTDKKKMTERPTFEARNLFTFQDTGGDQGVGSVKDFCRFHGSPKKIVCGYDQASMAQWYELREHERPEGCERGVCRRGAYERGYYCAVVKSPQIYANKKRIWLCGFDRAPAGRALIRKAHWVCDGGKWLKTYLDPQGDRGTLRCGKRAFQWVESTETSRLAAKLDPRTHAHAWVQGHGARATALQATEMGSRLQEFFTRVLSRLSKKQGESKDLAQQHRDLEKQLGDTQNALNEFLRKHPKHQGDKHQQRFKELNAQIQSIEQQLKTTGKMRTSVAADIRDLIPEAHDLRDRLSRPFTSHGFSPHEERLHILLSQASSDKLQRDLGRLIEIVSDLKADEAGFLGHRTAMRNFYLRDFDKILRKDHPKTFEHLRRGLREIMGPTMANDDRLAGLRGLVGAVRENRRAPDGHWLQEVRNALTDETHGFLLKSPVPGHEPIMERLLRSAFLNHAMFDMLSSVRNGVIQAAEAYTTALRHHRAHARHLTRYELLEAARITPVHPHEHGTLFCAEDLASEHDAKTGKVGFRGKKTYLCGASPLLLTGVVKRLALKKLPEFRALWEEAQRKAAAAGDAAVAHNVEDDLRTQAESAVGGGWCYGATAGETTKVAHRSYALEKRGQSPWVVGVPRFEGRARRHAGWLRCENYQYTDETWFSALLANEKELPKPEEDSVSAGTRAGHESGEAAKSMSAVGGAMSSGLGAVGDLSKIIGLLGIDLSFIEKHVQAAKEAVTKIVEETKKELDAQEKQRAQIEEDEKKKVEEHFNAQLKLEKAGANKPKTLVEAAEAAEKALKAFREGKPEKLKRIGELKKKLREEAAKKQPQQGLIQQLFNELSTLLANKITEFIKPKAHQLVKAVLDALQPAVEAIKAAVLGVIGSVPFVGGALATAASMAFGMFWPKMVELIADKMAEIAGRLLADALRGGMAPFVAEIRKRVQEGIRGICASAGAADFCPAEIAWFQGESTWMGRAIACPGVRHMKSELDRIAARGRRELRRRTADLVRQAPAMARRIANAYLRPYGHTYESWLAIAGPRASAAQRAIALRIAPEIERGVRVELAARTAAAAAAAP